MGNGHVRCSTHTAGFWIVVTHHTTGRDRDRAVEDIIVNLVIEISTNRTSVRWIGDGELICLAAGWSRLTGPGAPQDRSAM